MAQGKTEGSRSHHHDDRLTPSYEITKNLMVGNNHEIRPHLYEKTHTQAKSHGCRQPRNTTSHPPNELRYHRPIYYRRSQRPICLRMVEASDIANDRRDSSGVRH